jgi:hypothetical protein
MWLTPSGLFLGTRSRAESDNRSEANEVQQHRSPSSRHGVTGSPAARVGVVGPKRATRLSVPSVDLISSRLTRPCGGGAGLFKGDSLPGPIFFAILHKPDRFAATIRAAQAGSPCRSCAVGSRMVGPGLGCLGLGSCRVHRSGEQSRHRPAMGPTLVSSLRSMRAGAVVCENQSGSPGQEGRHRSLAGGGPGASRADRRYHPGPRGG